MKNASRVAQVLFGVVLAVILTACGGGGTGSSTISYTGLTTQASFTDTNSATIATNAYQGGSTGSSIGNIAAMSPGSSEVNQGKPRHLILAKVVEKAVRKINLSSAGQSASKAVTSESIDIPGDCLGSPGNASGTVTFNDVTGEISGTINFNSYCSQGYVTSGGTNISGTVDAVTGDFIQFSASFNALTVTSSSCGDTLTAGGGFNISVAGLSETLTINMRVKDNSTSEVFWFENYSVAATDYGSYVDVSITGGKFYHPDYGYVTVATTTPMRFYVGSDWPSQGIIVYTGSAGTKAKLTVLTSSQYQITTAADVDGLYNDYDSGPIYWSDICDYIGDATEPSDPNGLSATAISSSQINLSWNASSDNVGVAGYKVFKAGVYIDSVPGTTANITGLSPSTQYCFKVLAYDAAGNESGQSAQACATTQAASLTPVTLASGLNYPEFIAVDSTSVYWIEDDGSGTLKKVGLNGGAVTTLASGLTNGGQLVVDSTSVYWTQNEDPSGVSGVEEIKKIGKNGGTVTTLVSGLYNGAEGLGVNSAGVYWTEYDSVTKIGAVKKVGLNGGTVTTLASGSYNPEALVVDSTSVYWTAYHFVTGQPTDDIMTLEKVGINGGTVTTLASGVLSLYTPLHNIAVDSASVYWARNSGDDWMVAKVGINGGTVTVLASGTSVGFRYMLVDSTGVYWSEHNNATAENAVKKVGINGGTVTTLASGTSVSFGSIAVDSTSVYWTDYFGGTVNKIAK